MPTLNWVGKEQIINHHSKVDECVENIGEENSKNLIAKGDNLLALKSLLPYYKGKVKTIYIDSPYNTDNTSWIYNDSVDSPIIKKWLNKTVDSDDLSRTDKWLYMMHPRLKLLYQFLREDIEDSHAKSQLDQILMLFRLSDNMRGMCHKFKKAKDGKNGQFDLQFEFDSNEYTIEVVK